MRKSVLLILLLLTSLTNYSQQISIIPQPLSVQQLSGSFALTSQTALQYDKGAALSAEYLDNYLKNYYHFKLKESKKVSGDNKSHNTIVLKIDATITDSTRGAYTLSSENNKITITSKSQEGIFYGVQTLIQLLPVPHNQVVSSDLQIPNIQISDAPRFAYRGMMLDVGRYFMPVSFVKKFIDYLALHKMNFFHWHLTEDQGWRIEIKKYPRLTSVGAWRNGSSKGLRPQSKENDYTKTGGFYTQKQIKEVVKYASERYITIIPEIEMPGHSSAAIAAYPQLSCFPDSSTKTGDLNWAGPTTGKQVQQTWGVFEDVYAPTPYTFHFIENVLDEVMALFPSKYIHIGGDECPKTYWKESPYCQNLIKKEGLKNEEGLQSYFISKIEKYLNSKGRSIIGWDEILEGGLAPNATVQSWRGEKGGVQAAKLQHNVIMSPMFPLYFTRPQIKHEDSITVRGYLPLSQVYKYDPVGKLDAASKKYVIGTEGCLWAEYMRTPAKVEYMLFPRMAALSEVSWTSPKNKNYDNFVHRLTTQVARYHLWDINYCLKYTTE